MEKKSKKRLIFIILIIVIIILLLLRTCHSCNSSSITNEIVHNTAIKDTIPKEMMQKDTLAVKKIEQTKLEKNYSDSKGEKATKKKQLPSSKKERKHKTTSLFKHTAKDTILVMKKDTLISAKKQISYDTISSLMRDTITAKETSKTQAINQDTLTTELAIHAQKPIQDTLSSLEYIQQVKDFFSSVIIVFEGLDKNQEVETQLKEITHFRVFVKMATEQPLKDNFLKKIFVRISDSTTGKLIAFKGLSSIVQSITLYNKQETDYSIAQQANFNNEEKSSTIERVLEKMNTFKPKNNITIRIEVLCQGIKIGEKMTHFFVEKKSNK